MKIQDLLRKDVMLLDLQATEKTAAIEEMIHSLVEHGYVTDFETFKEGILAREALTSTGLGDGIAMPHSKNAAVKEATVLFAKSNKGVDYESLDGQATDLFFMIAAPEGAIPFGAADPARAIPSFILGSAVAGGLVGLANIKLMAPHGGIFVIALTSNALLYLVFVLVGAIVSGVVYGYLRKPQAVK